MAKSDATALMTVQVCYALPERQTLLDVSVPVGATVAEAIAASGICIQHPDIDLAQQRTGVFGHLRALDYVLSAGERVEIYRALQADPKAARAGRVARARAAGSVEGRKWNNRISR